MYYQPLACYFCGVNPSDWYCRAVRPCVCHLCTFVNNLTVTCCPLDYHFYSCNTSDCHFYAIEPPDYHFYVVNPSDFYLNPPYFHFFVVYSPNCQFHSVDPSECQFHTFRPPVCHLFSIVLWLQLLCFESIRFPLPRCQATCLPL